MKKISFVVVGVLGLTQVCFGQTVTNSTSAVASSSGTGSAYVQSYSFSSNVNGVYSGLNAVTGNASGNGYATGSAKSNVATPVTNTYGVKNFSAPKLETFSGR